MIAWLVLVALATSAGEGAHAADAGVLPVCSNRVVNEVVKRAGCTLGDGRCWARSGGFCTDWVEARVAAAAGGKAMRLEAVDPEQVRKGDVAVFAGRAHYAYVERVVVGAGGNAVAVDVSEYNFGRCWVDEEAMVTDQYEVVSRRRGIPVAEVDGGFMRPHAVGP